MAITTSRRARYQDVEILMSELIRLVNSFKCAFPESAVKIGLEWKATTRRGSEVLKSTIEPQPQEQLPGMEDDEPTPWGLIVNKAELRERRENKD